MKRPVNIGELLLRKDSKTDENLIQKPFFLSKSEREEIKRRKRDKPSNGLPDGVSKETGGYGGKKRLVEQPGDEDSDWRSSNMAPKKGSFYEEDEENSVNRAGKRAKKGAQTRSQKFKFDWAPEEDTLGNYEPIVGSRSSQFNRYRNDELENMYMGKHWSEKSLQEMTERDWRILREDYHIMSKGGSIEQPLRNWDEVDSEGFQADLARIIEKELKFSEPTPIQRITIPNVTKGRDFLGIAATGSGKTLAFLIPILMKLWSLPVLDEMFKLEGPRALILAPTRELAQQIENEAKRITRLWSRPCGVCSIVGGHSIEEIALSLSEGCEILVATPGRLIDCLENHVLVLKQVSVLVLDEADRMIDLGFEEQLTNILARTGIYGKKQTMMFTATMSPSLEKIANGYLKKPAYVSVGATDARPLIKQKIEFLPSEEQRFALLAKTILPSFEAPVIIFINYKATADWLASKFYSETTYRVAVLHGSKSQEQRERALNLIRTGKADILIATNVAGRGIDIQNVSLVVNFQMSKSIDDYIHRIGRTGRAGKSGTAITFLSEGEDGSLVESLYKYVKKNDELGTNEFSTTVRRRFNLENSTMKAIIH
ncbi:LAMI_0H05182g1_1 [Lachancea mirantina]|uniref:RNA helicase n=1 Tax=Lachancea mirantina TaxID=1230905 RepID=A0A1G4KEZ4_9SACH|nr:LAMI_0H05182g1_1 [Lachancea mirantina]